MDTSATLFSAISDHSGCKHKVSLPGSFDISHNHEVTQSESRRFSNFFPRIYPWALSK